MGTEVVVFGYATPVGIDHCGVLFSRADAVFPVIFICKTTAWPAQVGNVDMLERIHDVVANAARIGDVGSFADINAVVYATTQVFGKVPINMFVNVAAFFVGIEKDIGHDFAFL
jgi:hypothetical protein